MTGNHLLILQEIECQMLRNREILASCQTVIPGYKNIPNLVILLVL